MGIMLITFKIMPETVDTDLKKIEEEAKEVISGFGGNCESFEREPIAFGLNALKVSFSLDESKEIDPIEEKVKGIEGVVNVEVCDMRRAVG